MYKVTTVRIREDIYREAKRRGIIISKVLEKTLEQIIEEERRKERERLKKQVARIAARIKIETVREALDELRR